MHLVAVRNPYESTVATAVVVADRIDHQRVAFPVPDGISAVARYHLGRMTAIQMDMAHVTDLVRDDEDDLTIVLQNVDRSDRRDLNHSGRPAHDQRGGNGRRTRLLQAGLPLLE